MSESESTRLYTVKWPKRGDHAPRSVSGVLVEANVQRQVALHFFDEYRELEEEVQYMEDGSRSTEPRDITYRREITDTLLISESAARQLRDVLNSFFEEAPATPGRSNGGSRE